MTEMESPLEDYADGLGFHFDGYFIWRLLYRRVGDALSGRLQFLKVRGSFTEFKNLTFKDIELVTILYDFRHVRK